MRINAGKWKGRNIITVPGLETRPTPDILKQALFNIIGEEIKDAELCDLFAGTGSVAFEALSRGARHVTLVENGKAALTVISKNADNFGCKSEITILPRDVFIAMRSLQGKCFDFIFFDPPYNQNLEKTTLEGIRDNCLLDENGVVIVQFDAKNTKKIDIPQGFVTVDERRYGRNAMIFLKLGENDSEE